MTALRSALLLALAVLAAGCSGTKKFKPEEVPGAIAEAQASLEQGDTERALKLMRGAQKTENLPTDTRNEVRLTLEVAAERRIEELSAPGEDPEELADLVELYEAWDKPEQVTKWKAP